MTTYQFLRPAIFATLIGVVVIAICTVAQNKPTDPIRQTGILADLLFPSPVYEPDEVVRIQVEAMRSESQGLGALQCYCFAAPSNRMITGPLPRFTQMLRTSSFESVCGSKTFSIGKPEIVGDRARCTVVFVGAGREVTVFNWVLKKQVDTPYESCWMTAGVFQIDATNPEGDDADEFVMASR